MMDEARQIGSDPERHNGGDRGPRRHDYQDAGKKALVRRRMPFAKAPSDAANGNIRRLFRFTGRENPSVGV
jgi:hypothetical protein